MAGDKAAGFDLGQFGLDLMAQVKRLWAAGAEVAALGRVGPAGGGPAGAGAGFAAGTSEEDTRYGMSLDAKEFVDGASYRQYFWKGDYPRLPGPGGNSAAGDRSPEGFGPTHRNNLFSITAKVKAKP